MPITLLQAFFDLGVALICGALIGTERQARQRMAGLRTNALVAVGAAGFVVYSALYPNEIAQTRVAAQVVSGIGFLGAGLMFRHGFQVHGLNTAATLWCSAAVGVLSGAGALDFAVMLTALIVFINLGLRPVVRWIKRRSGADVGGGDWRLVLRLDAGDEAEVRRMTLGALAAAEVAVMRMVRTTEEATQAVCLDFTADPASGDASDLHRTLAALLADPRIRAAEVVQGAAS